MSDNSPFLIVVQPYDEAIDWAIRRLSNAGLHALRTFDLQAARLGHAECPCPHHGTEKCDCQMVILLVYGSQQQPISMVAHSFDGSTWFSLVDTPQQRADPCLETAIVQALGIRNNTTPNQIYLK